LARVAGFPDFCGEAGMVLEKEGNRRINRARKELSSTDMKKITEQHEQSWLGKKVEGEDPGAQFQAEQYGFVKDLQLMIGERLIRRTGESKQPNGLSINPLPPCIIHSVGVVLPEKEMSVLTKEMDRMNDKWVSVRIPIIS
jgi:hypothetical protein